MHARAEWPRREWPLGDWEQSTSLLDHCESWEQTCAAVHAAVSASRLDLFGAKLSRLRPNTHIRPHCGPATWRLRVHLGVRVPHGDFRLRLRAANETRAWAEGRCLVLDDSFEHEAWFDAGPGGDADGRGQAHEAPSPHGGSTEGSTSVVPPPRVVLILDVERPAECAFERHGGALIP